MDEEFNGLVELHKYGDICQVHNVECDYAEYQSELGPGYPLYWCTGYVCPVCREEAIRTITSNPPADVAMSEI